MAPSFGKRSSLNRYNELMIIGNIIYRVHALQRMFEREISEDEVRRALETGEVIEDYSSEMPEPSRLILAYRGKHPFHLVASENSRSNEVTIITVYVPSPNRWGKDNRSRKA